MGKEINERRTSNIERPTSNNVVCLLIKERAKGIYPAEFNLTQPATGSGSDYYKIDKAQRNQNSMFGVGRSMFDVRFFFYFVRKMFHLGDYWAGVR